MANMLTRAQAARLLDVSVPALDRALKSGRIFYADPNGLLFDQAALVAQWDQNRQRRRKPVPASVATPPAGQESEAELRRRLLRAQVLTAERTARSEDGERVPLAALGRALRTWFQLEVVALVGLGSKFEGAVLGRIPADARAGLRRELVGIEDEAINASWQALMQALYQEAPEWTSAFAAQFVAEKHSAPPTEV